MPIPTTMSDLSTTSLVNSPQGGDNPTTTDNMHRAIQSILRHTQFKGTDIASASTTDLSTATGEFVDVTGTTTINSFGTVSAGITRTVRFTGALTITHNATSMILRGSNITTYANYIAVFMSLGSGNWILVSDDAALTIQNQSANAFTTSGTAPAFTVVTSPVYGAFINGKTALNITFNANVANGAQPTLVVDAIAVKNIKQYDPAGNLINGRIRTNYEYKLIYDGTQYIILNPIQGYVFDNTGYVGADVVIGVNERVDMTFAAQTTMDLRIAAAADQEYDLIISGTAPVTVAGSGAYLQINNTDFAAGFDSFFVYSNNSTPLASAQPANSNGFRLEVAGSTPFAGEYKLSTTTTRKRLTGKSVFSQTTGATFLANFISAQLNTTTPVTKIGSIITPAGNAFTGTVSIIRRR